MPTYRPSRWRPNGDCLCALIELPADAPILSVRAGRYPMVFLWALCSLGEHALEKSTIHLVDTDNPIETSAMHHIGVVEFNEYRIVHLFQEHEQ